MTLSSTVALVGDSIDSSIRKEMRLHIYDTATNQTFLIDSGSIFSIIPVSIFKNKPEVDTLQLFAANSSTIKTYGTKILKLDLNLRRCFSWMFIIADITTAIIGADFLTHYNLLIDLKNQRLVDPLTSLSTKGESIKTKIFNISTISTSLPEKYAQLLKQYIEITRPNYKPNLNNSQYAHRIITHGSPVSARSYKLAGEKAASAKSQISDMLQDGIIRPSRSPFASPIILSKKKNNEWRLCGDYRRLNSITEADKYVPHLFKTFSLVCMVPTFSPNLTSTKPTIKYQCTPMIFIKLPS